MFSGVETDLVLFDIGYSEVAHFEWDSELTSGDKVLKPVG